MKKSRIIYIIISVMALALVSFYFDIFISELISESRTDYLNGFFYGITLLGSKIAIFILLTGLFLWKSHKRKWILPIWLTLFFTAAVSFLLKIIVRRPRPYIMGVASTFSSLQEASHAIWNFSFASSHAMLAFSVIPILSKHYPRFKYVWIVFASLVAFSRVYFGLHFLSDVIVGGLIGYIIGFIIVKMEEKNKTFTMIYDKLFSKFGKKSK